MRMRLSEGFVFCASAPGRAAAKITITKIASADFHNFVVGNVLMTCLPHQSDRCITNKTSPLEVCDLPPNRRVHEFCSQPDHEECACASCASSDQAGLALRPRALPSLQTSGS